jgi:hypothetical protein
MPDSLRVEFNPAALGAPGIAYLKEQLESLVPEAKPLARAEQAALD